MLDPTTPSFQSVKLPSDLVNAAKVEARTSRRSTAAQIEYWAMLGRSFEAQGLTVAQAREAMVKVERRAQAKSIVATLDAIDADGSLQRGIERVIAENRAKAQG